MAEAPSTPGDAGSTQAAQPRLMIQSQYIKDLSFENPRSPASLDPGQGRPEITVRIDVRSASLGDERHEVILHLALEGKVKGEVGFVLELSYAGVFALLNIPQDRQQLILLVECPRLLFPFARRIVADASRDGGFPPLMLDPIDFLALYARRQQQAQAAPAASGQPLDDPTVGPSG